MATNNFLKSSLPKIDAPKVAPLAITGEDAKRIIKDYVERQIAMEVESVIFVADDEDMFVRMVRVSVKLSD